MEKKVYISPKSEMMDLRAMNAMMDDPMLGPASKPKILAPKRNAALQPQLNFRVS